MIDFLRPLGPARLLIPMLCCWLAPASAQAASFVVNSPADAVDANPGDGLCEVAVGSGVCTLRAAIMEANRAPGSTVDLTLVPGGIVLLDLTGGGVDDVTSGDLNITADMTILGAGTSATTVDANGAVTLGRAFRVERGSVVIAGITIRNGQVSDGGGGLAVRGGTVVLKDAAVSSNRSGFGGGIYIDAGGLTIERTTIDQNRSFAQGGGIFAVDASTLLVVDSTISGNVSESPLFYSDQGGGGIFAAATVVTLQNTTVSGNSAYHGGGIQARGPVRVFNSTITGNTARGQFRSFPGQGGGVFVSESAPDLFTFQNTILAGNLETLYTGLAFILVPGDCEGTVISNGYNLLGSPQTPPTTNPCNVIGAVQLVNDARLGPIQANGGPTATHALLPDSPAIDGGDPGGCRDASGQLLSTDQRGTARPFAISCDIGAFEVNACVYSLGSQSTLAAYVGTAGLLPVVVNDGRCSWTAVSDAPWIQVLAGSTGSGSGTVSYSVLPNAGRSRRGTVIVEGQTFTVLQASLDGARGDFDGDARTDISLFLPSPPIGVSKWFILESAANHSTVASFQLGGFGDVPVPGDYDGDGKNDIAVYRPSSGHWFILESSTGYGAATVVQWGGDGDRPVPADYDGDGKTDFAVYRPSTGTWYFVTSGSGFTRGFGYVWGTPTDLPLAGDFDGDGRADIVVYRPLSGHWFVLQSSTEFTASITYQWGTAGDVPMPGDYDGDGLLDPGVYRPSATTSMWYFVTSTSGYTRGFGYEWGVSAWDVPVPGDYDGDAISDLAVYRAQSGHWFILQSRTGFTAAATYQWSAAGARPVLQRQ